ncbi:MAG TPA: DUF2306 domain-containing protein [Aestuariivirga sp.]
MTLNPILEATPAIQIHVVAVTAAIVLTLAQLIGKKGVTTHRVLGYSWAVSMLTAAGSSFFIHTIKLIGPFSPLHLLAILTLVTVPIGIYAARRHDVKRHKKIMLNLVVFALCGAGLFALILPGRIMFQVLFGS